MHRRHLRRLRPPPSGSDLSHLFSHEQLAFALQLLKVKTWRGTGKGSEKRLGYTLQRKEIVDELKVQSRDAVRANALAANDRNYGNIVPLAFYTQKRSRCYLERTKYRSSAEAKVLRHGHFAFRHVSVLIK